MNQLARLPSRALPVPALVAAAGDQARMRFLEFFAANIRNAHTRRAYIYLANGGTLEHAQSMAAHEFRAPPSSMTGPRNGSSRTKWSGS